MSSDRMRAELGAFLRDRRARVAPEQVGLPPANGRRVPGLRREELAIVAGVSPDHYQRIEQGRVNPSAQALDAIATALGLDDVERGHLHTLAENVHTPATRRRGGFRPALPAGLDTLVDGFAGPAFLLNHCRDLLAWNELGARLLVDFGALPADERNMVWLILTDPRLRPLYTDWETTAREQVATLRRASGRYPGDPRIEQLVGRLSTVSADFVRWWSRREVREKTAGTKTLDHPEVGRITLGFHVLHPAAATEFELFTYYPTDPVAVQSLDRLRRRSAQPDSYPVDR